MSGISFDEAKIEFPSFGKGMELINDIIDLVDDDHSDSGDSPVLPEKSQIIKTDILKSI